MTTDTETRPEGPTSEQWAALARPFPQEEIAKLPKPYSRDSQKGNCRECGGYHGLPAMHLDYVGHAETTMRLLEVDPNWTWEPMGRNPDGTPVIVNGCMWINLTVLGVTRPGVGDAQGKQGGNALKEIIGDAIRNAAMRFGVATYLWGKSEMAQNRANWQGDAPAAAAPVEPSPTEVLLNEVAEAADAAGISRKQVSEEWAQAHNGQFIGEATALEDLALMRDDLKVRANQKGTES